MRSRAQLRVGWAGCGPAYSSPWYPHLVCMCMCMYVYVSVRMCISARWVVADPNTVVPDTPAPLGTRPPRAQTPPPPPPLHHTAVYVSIRQHTSAYVSIRQHTSAYDSICQHTSTYIRQHTYVSIHTSAYVISLCGLK